MVIKILCLHGNRSCGDTLKKSMKNLLKLEHIEFIFITSPIIYDNSNNNYDAIYRKWWTGDLTNIFTNPYYDTLYESIKFVHDKYIEFGPFDGILGFSQGAVLANIILYLNEYPEFFDDKYQHINFNFKFAILCSMSIITDNSFKKILDKKIKIPILNVYGDRDELLDFNHSQSLAKYFENCINYQHDGKHHIPSKSKFKSVLLDFLTRFN